MNEVIKLALTERLEEYREDGDLDKILEHIGAICLLGD